VNSLSIETATPFEVVGKDNEHECRLCARYPDTAEKYRPTLLFGKETDFRRGGMLLGRA
jgi:hypothetical protein